MREITVVLFSVFSRDEEEEFIKELELRDFVY